MSKFNIMRLVTLDGHETDREYWNNEFGWVDQCEATLFTEEEHDRFSELPIDGEWVVAAETSMPQALTPRERATICAALSDWKEAVADDRDYSTQECYLFANEIDALCERLDPKGAMDAIYNRTKS
jgi:hypothetical protein